MTPEVKEEVLKLLEGKIKEPLPEDLILAGENHARAKLLVQGRSFEELDDEYLALFIADAIKQLEFSRITLAICLSYSHQNTFYVPSIS